jgi:V/A-type H+-transporting ATPase subunit K
MSALFASVSGIALEGDVAPEVIVNNGPAYAALGAAIAIVLAGIGSSIGVGRAGQASAGLLSKDPSKFGSCLVLQLLPATQCIYGFVIAFMTLSGVSGIETTAEGLKKMIFCLPIGIVGLVSAIYQGQVAIGGINLVGKQEGTFGRAMTMAAMVEFFAILSFVVSIMGVNA